MKCIQLRPPPSYNSKGLAKIVETTCNLMTQNYKSEVKDLDCGKLSAGISNYYDTKFEGKVHGAGKSC